MKKQKTSTQLAPKLRFPEFVNDGEWEAELLGRKHISAFVNEKVSAAKNLTWGGLEGTITWSTLTSTQQLAIESTNNSYKNGSSGAKWNN